MRALLPAACLLLTALLVPTASAQDTDDSPVAYQAPCIGLPLWDYITPVYDFAICEVNYGVYLVNWAYNTAVDTTEPARCDIIGGPACTIILPELTSEQQAAAEPGILILYDCVGLPLWDYLTPVLNFVDCNVDFAVGVANDLVDWTKYTTEPARCDIVGGPACTLFDPQPDDE